MKFFQYTIYVLLAVLMLNCSTNKKTEEITMEEKKGLAVGDTIPAILGADENGVELKASDFAGKKLVLYFYPKDSTPGCTAQACSLRDNYDSLLAKGYAVLGVSVDSAASHKKFIEKQKLPFSLIADVDKKLVEEFGVWGEKTLAGRKYMGTFRTTFIIDEKGVIEEIISPKEIKTKDHASQILDK